MSYKSGFISIIGRPNAGKSTLLNAILQEKVAITTPKPQTTRNNISGILTREDAQFVFVDTPGIHKPKHELGRTLNRNAYTAIAEADVNYWMVDATQPFGSGDEFILEKMKSAQIPVFLILNKIDLLDKEAVLTTLSKWQSRMQFAEIFPVSALKRENVEHLLEVTKSYLQEGVKYFPDDMISDHGENFQIAEIIREKVLYKTNEEVPHSVAVIVEKKEESDTRMELSALIVVERSSQKSILIGKQGAMIRGIRLAAQKELKEKFGKKVELELYVRVEKNWRNRSSKLHQLASLLSKSFSLLSTYSLDSQDECFEKIERIEDRIDELTASYRQAQIERLMEKKVNVLDCVIYSEILTDVERVSDHIMNIIQEAKRCNFTLSDEAIQSDPALSAA